MKIENLLSRQNLGKTRVERVIFTNTIMFIFTIIWTFVLHFFLIYITKPETCGMYDCILRIIVRTFSSFHNLISIPGFIYFTYVDLTYDNVKFSLHVTQFKYLCEVWIPLLVLAFINEFRIYMVQYFFD
tara:strand:- start:1817 stop:2203 length:387 start_codon:yes stop_codon:yes gene_type:complete